MQTEGGHSGGNTGSNTTSSATTPFEFTGDLLTTIGSSPRHLLQLLHALQCRFSHIPDESVDLLADSLGLGKVQIRGVIGFYSFLHETPRGDYDILFSDNITDRMLGNQQLLSLLCDGLGVEPGVPRSDGRVTVASTSCTGMCDQGPAMLVNGIAVTRLDRERIADIVSLVEDRVALAEWPAGFFRVDDNIVQPGLLLSRQSADGAALHKLLEFGADRMLKQIDESGLRGRGGAGFRTALKWRLCREADDHGDGLDRVVVCNADEGEPGTFKDRVLLNSYADDVIEGMTLCAGIIGARHGFIYLRGEYLYLRDQLEAVLSRRRQQGLLGTGIAGQDGFDFDIELHLGAGAYICGEESSLIESLEGKRGVPRTRPPFPVTEGYLGKPTVVNNVETFLAATHIAEVGADSFRSTGTAESSGTKILSVCGDCELPGIYEVPFGTSIGQILEDCGAASSQAVQVAGAAGTTIPPAEFDRLIAFEDVATAGSFMVFDENREIIDMVQNFAHFFVHESCGFCTPCRVGGSLMKDLVNKVASGHASDYDLEEMVKIGQLMQASSHCGLGTTAPNCVLDTLDKFPHIYQRLVTSSGYEPAFDLDAALQDARDITGRDDPAAHIRSDR